jgi:hypothetical protein
LKPMLLIIDMLVDFLNPWPVADRQGRRGGRDKERGREDRRGSVLYEYNPERSGSHAIVCCCFHFLAAALVLQPKLLSFPSDLINRA